MIRGLEHLREIYTILTYDEHLESSDLYSHLDVIEEELEQAEKDRNNIERVKILLSKEMLYKYLGLNVGSEVLDYANKYIDDILKGEK